MQKISDFIDSGSSIDLSNNDLQNLLLTTYNVTAPISKYCFFGVNLQWPKYNLPTNYQKYFISFHTEYIDVEWVVNQCKQVYPKPVILVSDFDIKIVEPWPDNLTSLQYITIHKQLQKSIQHHGMQKTIKFPKYKLSSLSFRMSQFKRFITAYLLKNFPKDQMILSYHNRIGKQEDLHGFPAGFDHLENLSLDTLSKTMINIDDVMLYASPIANAAWQSPAYQESLFNLTNESFHYSNSMYHEKHFQYPGPYLTEKTFKPLLAGRPFIAVGQAHSLEFLNSLGFKTHFGFNNDYDSDPNDLTRIKGIFDMIDYVNSTDIVQLFERSLPDAQHNLKYCASQQFFDFCEDKNQKTVNEIKNFVQQT
jgi:hypothetical protein